MLDDTERRVYHGYNWRVAPGSVALHCAGLVKRYGEVIAVNGLDLQVVRGECFGLLGPNGAGKTTTIEILEGLLTADAGEVTVLGRRWDRDAAALRPRLGIQLQETQLADKLTVHETLRMFRSFYPDGPEVDALLATVELGTKRDSWVSKLSGGQKQRLSVACALAGRPDLLFLDEPTTGLDPQSRRQLWAVLERFREAGGTILITTHYMDEAHALCDRVGIMDRGTLIALGTPRELVQSLGAEHVVEFAVTEGSVPSEAELAALPGVRDVRPAMSEAKGGPGPHSAESNGETHTSLSTSEVHLTIPALLDLLRRHDATLSLLGTHSATLEDVFVTLTGRQLRDD
ncbi:MAG: ABC transporter ATP-binding protein [Acidobacteriota bacterium]|nr:ABC transporter ATP-binding protein [Acidobacteriota bacterium]